MIDISNLNFHDVQCLDNPTELYLFVKNIVHCFHRDKNIFLAIYGCRYIVKIEEVGFPQKERQISIMNIDSGRKVITTIFSRFVRGEAVGEILDSLESDIERQMGVKGD